jgi:hypothetical protein
MYKDSEKEGAKQQADRVSGKMERNLLGYLGDLLRELDRQIDRRLVVTFVSLSMALLMHRHRNEGGWMSQLGSYLEPMNAEAGKKRIQKLLYSRKWDSGLLEKHLWRLGEQRVAAGEQAGETMLAIWDESVVEKSEALKLEGLGSVRSSKAVRLKRIKPGYFNPPGGRPIIVPGFHWLQVLICGMNGSLVPAHTRFWSNRGEQASTRRTEEWQVLQELADRLRARVIHVFDLQTSDVWSDRAGVGRVVRRYGECAMGRELSLHNVLRPGRVRLLDLLRAHGISDVLCLVGRCVSDVLRTFLFRLPNLLCSSSLRNLLTCIFRFDRRKHC